MRVRALDRAGRRARSLARAVAVAIAALAAGLSGCGAVKQDVYQYYRQMAQNYHEAGEKAKFDAITLDAESRSHLQANDVHKYNRARREVARLKDWEARCESQRQRFEKAAKKLEPGLPSVPPGEATAEGSATDEPGGQGGISHR
jgi:hypothetical protein